MPSDPPTKPKRSREEIRAQIAVRLRAIRLKMAIYRKLDEKGAITPAAIGNALDLPAVEAAALLSRRRLREGDLAQLEAAAVRLGVHDPG